MKTQFYGSYLLHLRRTRIDSTTVNVEKYRRSYSNCLKHTIV